MHGNEGTCVKCDSVALWSEHIVSSSIQCYTGFYIFMGFLDSKEGSHPFLPSRLFSLSGLLRLCQSGKRRRRRVCSAISATALTSMTQRTVPPRPRAPTLYLTPHITATRLTRGPTVTSARPSDTPQSPATMTRPSKGSKNSLKIFNFSPLFFPPWTHFSSYMSHNPAWHAWSLQIFPYCIFILYLCISRVATVLI